MSPPDNFTTSTSQHGGHDALIYDEVAGAGAETHADVAPDKPSDELREGLGLEAAKDSRGQDELPQTQVPDDQQPSTATHPSVSQSTASDLQQPQTATASESPAAAAAVEPSPQPVPEVQTDLISLSPEPTAAAKGKQPEHVTAATPGVLLDATKKPSAIAIPRPPNMNLHTYHDDSSSSQQYLSAEPSHYVDPTPPTPQTSQPPSRTPSNAARSHKSDDHSPSRGDRSDDDKRYLSEDEQEGGSRSEIQSIMEQFSESGGGPGAEEVMSPRLEIASPMLSSPVQHPPRKSSLAPLSTSISNQLQDMHLSTSPVSVRSKDRGVDAQAPPVPPKDGTIETPPRHDDSLSTPLSPQLTMHRPPPPEPEPEPALPFDFHRFLEQLRNKKADPVARYLKSFLSEFGKRQWMVHEQVKIISDFLAFIANKMAVCEVWRDVSDAEFDNAREGMEKLVMNRLYSQTFSPAIPAPKPIPGAKPKRKGGDTPMGPGRRGQHQEDVERDDIVTQKINIYGWVKEEHLDIPAVGDSGRRFLKLAQQELLKIKSYRAPRDKIICVLNCCKVIFGLLKHNKSDSSADSFMPLLIYVVLHSNPEHLVSNVQYILRFRNQEKLGGEAGYYLSSLMGAIQFIENLDRTTLTITDDEFEQHVEAAVSAIAEKHQATSPRQPQQQVFNEKTSLVAGEAATARGSMDGHDQTATPRRSTSSNEHDSGDDKAAITGLLRTIQKPLTTIGRIFSDDGGSSSAPQPGGRPAPTSEHAPLRTSTSADEDRDSGRRPSSRHNLSAEEAAARQASAEAAEAERLHRAEHANVVETLAGMFPDLDKDIISDVVYQKEGRVGLAVDACLALST